MNRRSLFGRLIGGLVGAKVAPSLTSPPILPARKPSKLDMLFIGDSQRFIDRLEEESRITSWWGELDDSPSRTNLEQIIYERSGR